MLSKHRYLRNTYLCKYRKKHLIGTYLTSDVLSKNLSRNSRRGRSSLPRQGTALPPLHSLLGINFNNFSCVDYNGYLNAARSVDGICPSACCSLASRGNRNEHLKSKLASRAANRPYHTIQTPAAKKQKQKKKQKNRNVLRHNLLHVVCIIVVQDQTKSKPNRPSSEHRARPLTRPISARTPGAAQ